MPGLRVHGVVHVTRWYSLITPPGTLRRCAGLERQARQDIRELMLRLTRENLARRHPPPPARLAGLAVDEPSFLRAARPMAIIDS